MTYFALSEYLCKCGRSECDAPKRPSTTLVTMLNLMRQQYGSPITITSGMRCAYWNKHEKGKDNSEHVTGEGADLACPTSHARWAMLDAARQAGFERIGIGKTFLHVGVSRSLPERVIWTYYPK